MHDRRRGHTPCGKRTLERGGFTLLELLVALFIFTLIGGAVYMMIRSSADAYSRGHATMEVYQSVRVGLDRMLGDLRRAVSPESIWNNRPEEEEDLEGFIDEVAGLEPVASEPENRDIVFEGDLTQCRFVTEDVMARGTGAGFDLREVVYRVDEDENVLIKEIRDSIIRRRLNELRAERTVNETDYRAAYPDEFEPTGEVNRLVIANNVVGMTLAYYDGSEWMQEWNSERILREEEYYDLPEEEQPQGPKERYGLPDAVAITLVISNGDEVSAITEIPARDMDLLLAVNETEFARREFASTIDYNRERQVVPRGGLRSRSFRERGRDGLSIGGSHRSGLERDAARDRSTGVSRGSRSAGGRRSGIGSRRDSGSRSGRGSRGGLSRRSDRDSRGRDSRDRRTRNRLR